MSDQLTFLSAAPPASRSASRESASVWMTRAATSRLSTWRWLDAFAPAGFYGRTSPESCRMTAEGRWEPSSGSWGNSLRIFRRQVRDGRSIKEAAEIAGITIGEARLHAADDAKNPPSPEAYELIGTIPTPEPVRAGPGQPKESTQVPKADTPHSEDPEGDLSSLVEITAGTMRGDVRDALMAWIKARPKMWPLMSESEQREAYNSADAFGWEICKQIAQRIAAEERPTIVAKLVEYKEKEGIEAKLKLSATGENILALHLACGREVLLVASGIEEFSAEAGPPDVNPDQPIMDMGGEYDDQ